MSDKELKQMSDIMFTKLNSKEELKNWILIFFGLDMPIGHIDPDSSSSPVEAMWEIYSTVKDNRGETNPGYIMLSAREGYKTLSASILEAILMIHFRITIAHLAAIQSQSAKAIQYINYFLNKIEPLLKISGWEKTSENKSKISYRTEEGEDVYIRVVVATMAGANSEHTNMLFIDEIDVISNVQAYEEAKLIPGFAKGLHPVTVKLSTRKFAFGLMQKDIDQAPTTGDKILNWNIIDVTERCPESRHKPGLPKQDVYVAKSLPLRTISIEEHNNLADAEKPNWDLMEGAYAGCVGCKLLPVCRGRLAARNKNSKNGLYKPVGAVINTFKKTSPDMAEAQLLCWKPSSKGLVYPRFEATIDKGNVISIDKALETLLGDEIKKGARELGVQLSVRPNENDLINVMKALKIDFYAGVDWGYTHDFVIVIFAVIPNGEIWVVDCYSQAGLEFLDCLEVAKNYRDKWNPNRWFADQAMPSHTKSFTKNGMKCPKFQKDVMGGIEAIRSKIVDGSGRRLFKVLNTENNKKIINSLQKHHFKLGSDGNPTLTPDDAPGVADQADAMRYVGQNLFPVKGHQKPSMVTTEQERSKSYNPTAEQQMREEIAKRVGDGPTSGGNGKKGGFFFSF